MKDILRKYADGHKNSKVCQTAGKRFKKLTITCVILIETEVYIF